MSGSRTERRHLFLAGLPGLALALWIGLGALVGWLTLSGAQQAALTAILGPLAESHGVLLFAWWLLPAVLAAGAMLRFHARAVRPVARLTDGTRALAEDPAAPDVRTDAAGPVMELAQAINALADTRRALALDMESRVAEASRSVAQQRDQLAALMAELEQSVVVCNLEGRILLYNARARALFRRVLHSDESPGIQASAAIGLGRSIHAMIEPAYLDHARAEVERRIARGEAGSSARFVITTPAGHLLQVSMAPVRPAGETGVVGSGEGRISGFVLLLDDITEEYEAHVRRDQRLLELTEASRASFASMQAALDMLDYPDLAPAEREGFHSIVRDEVRAMSIRLAALAVDAAQDLKTRWPLQNMAGADLLSTAMEHIHAATGAPMPPPQVEGAPWLSVDSFSLIRALTFLAGKLEAEQPGLELALRLSPAGGRVHLDLMWRGADLPAEKLTTWPALPMAGDLPKGAAMPPLCVRDVAERHGGEVWLEREEGGACSFFRFLLPVEAGEAVDLLSPSDSRPEYYDFDLLAARAGHRDLDERELGEISFTVFDTETTGLDPRGGDEILQIGATRIVNGKLLRGESFDQLVDPQRSIPEAGIAVHGVTPQMVRGQPTIAEVLPRFRAYVADTVLVGHNVAFDMRFLKLKEDSTGIVFDQPVLDTLLLASVVYPNEERHGLEALAERLGIRVEARHRALGDAIMTGEVFLKLVPLLRQRGILTLRQAREAAAESYYARLRY
ncbi:exonuclease domain-containing protein [Xanthobacter sp. TB0136]|uniref:exonuclease domain-containing protein n=1 Tax=Xanthobacter sp. TB0136 TaxID=3459177 RepID=UPI004039FE95